MARARRVAMAVEAVGGSRLVDVAVGDAILATARRWHESWRW